MARFTLQARWTPLYLVVIGVLLWVGYVTVTVARTPPDGATTPQELAQSATKAVAANDGDGFSKLLDYPTSDRHEFADDYMSTLKAGGDGAVEFSYEGKDIIAVTTDRGRYPLRIQQDGGGRWVVSFLPPF